MRKRVTIPDKRAYIDAFAPGIYANIRAYQKAADSYLREKLKETISHTLRKFSDRYPEKVSKRAKELADLLGIDLSDKLWTNRNICGKTDNKSNIVWEHSTPIKELAESLFKCKDMDCIRKALDEYSGVIWITREEDNELASRGYKNKRPDGWEKCYEDCGIEVLMLS
jgi:hypothetical protein